MRTVGVTMVVGVLLVGSGCAEATLTHGLELGAVPYGWKANRVSEIGLPTREQEATCDQIRDLGDLEQSLVTRPSGGGGLSGWGALGAVASAVVGLSFGPMTMLPGFGNMIPGDLRGSGGSAPGDPPVAPIDPFAPIRPAPASTASMPWLAPGCGDLHQLPGEPATLVSSQPGVRVYDVPVGIDGALASVRVTLARRGMRWWVTAADPSAVAPVRYAVQAQRARDRMHPAADALFAGGGASYDWDNLHYYEQTATWDTAMHDRWTRGCEQALTVPSLLPAATRRDHGGWAIDLTNTTSGPLTGVQVDYGQAGEAPVAKFSSPDITEDRSVLYWHGDAPIAPGATLTLHTPAMTAPIQAVVTEMFWMNADALQADEHPLDACGRFLP